MSPYYYITVDMFYAAMFYVDVAVVWGLPLPLLFGEYRVRLLALTISLQRDPQEAPVHRLHAPSPGLMTVGGMGSNSL